MCKTHALKSEALARQSHDTLTHTIAEHLGKIEALQREHKAKVDGMEKDFNDKFDHLTRDKDARFDLLTAHSNATIN